MPNTEPLFGNEKTRRPGARRQGLMAAAVAAVVLAAGAAALLLARPGEEVPLLRDPPLATVAVATIRDLLTVGGTLELGETESLVSPERATVLDTPVEEGETVKAGQVIVVISDDDLQTSLSQRRAELQKLDRQIGQAEAEDGFDARAQALGEAKARRELAAAAADRDRVAALFDRKLASQSELDSSDSKLAAAKEALDSLLLAGERNATLSRIAAENRASDRVLLLDEIAELERRIAACRIRATVAGVLYSLQAKKGKTAAQYEELAVIGRPSTLRAAVDLPETKANRVRVGMAATVYSGETPYPARVAFVATYASTSASSSGATVRAELEFDSPPADGVAGSSVTADLALGEIKDALVLPRGPYLTSGDYAAAYVLEGGVARKRAVNFGTADGQTIQVLSGLAEGDRVLTGNYSEFLHLDEVRVQLTPKEQS